MPNQKRFKDQKIHIALIAYGGYHIFSGALYFFFDSLMEALFSQNPMLDSGTFSNMFSTLGSYSPFYFLSGGAYITAGILLFKRHNFAPWVIRITSILFILFFAVYSYISFNVTQESMHAMDPALGQTISNLTMPSMIFGFLMGCAPGVAFSFVVSPALIEKLTTWDKEKGQSPLV